MESDNNTKCNQNNSGRLLNKFSYLKQNLRSKFKDKVSKGKENKDEYMKNMKSLYFNKISSSLIKIRTKRENPREDYLEILKLYYKNRKEKLHFSIEKKKHQFLQVINDRKDRQLKEFTLNIFLIMGFIAGNIYMYKKRKLKFSNFFLSIGIFIPVNIISKKLFKKYHKRNRIALLKQNENI